MQVDRKDLQWRKIASKGNFIMKNNEINIFELDELPKYVEIAYKNYNIVFSLINPMLFPEMISLNLSMVKSVKTSSRF